MAGTLELELGPRLELIGENSQISDKTWFKVGLVQIYITPLLTYLSHITRCEAAAAPRPPECGCCSSRGGRWLALLTLLAPCLHFPVEGLPSDAEEETSGAPPLLLQCCFIAAAAAAVAYEYIYVCVQVPVTSGWWCHGIAAKRTTLTLQSSIWCWPIFLQILIRTSGWSLLFILGFWYWSRSRHPDTTCTRDGTNTQVTFWDNMMTSAVIKMEPRRRGGIGSWHQLRMKMAPTSLKLIFPWICWRREGENEGIVEVETEEDWPTAYMRRLLYGPL